MTHWTTSSDEEIGSSLIVFHRTSFRQWSIAVIFVLNLVAVPGFGQQKQQAGDKENRNPEADATDETKARSSDDSDQISQRLSAVEKQASEAVEQVEKLTQENEALKARVEKQEAALQEKSHSDDDLSVIMDTIVSGKLEKMEEEKFALKIYGFGDVQWYKYILDDNAFYKPLWNDKNSFTVGHWHLYLEKSLTDKFRFLGEVRFLFQPYGDHTDLSGYQAYEGETEFEWVDTQTQDAVDFYNFDWGGIAIQQFWIEYKYNDKIGVRVGNYLTPWGVWNVDHASTVVIPGHRPFIITSQILPESQTGLNVFGRFFLPASISLEYALTLSNGRGPTARVYDLDENKAAGLSLSFFYTGPVSLSFGTYLYIGEYTDVEKLINPNLGSIYEFDIDVTENYIEKSMAFHLKLEWKGLLLQGEYCRGMTQYKKGGRPLFFAGYAPGQIIYVADFIQHAGYALLAYKLPFDIIDIRPYFIYEYQQPPDVWNLPQGNNYGGGLNWHVTPAVVWKIDFIYHQELDEAWGVPASRLNYAVISSQLAVAY